MQSETEKAIEGFFKVGDRWNSGVYHEDEHPDEDPKKSYNFQKYGIFALAISAILGLGAFGFMHTPKVENKVARQQQPSLELKVERIFTREVNKPGKLVYSRVLELGVSPEEVLNDFNLQYGDSCKKRMYLQDVLDSKGRSLYDSNSGSFRAELGDKLYFKLADGPCVRKKK